MRARVVQPRVSRDRATYADVEKKRQTGLASINLREIRKHEKTSVMNAKRDKVTALPHALTAADDSTLQGNNNLKERSAIERRFFLSQSHGATSTM